MQDLPSGLTLDIHIFVTGTSYASANIQTGFDEEDPEALDDDTNSESDQSGKDHSGENGSGSEKGADSENYISSGNDPRAEEIILSHPGLKIHYGRADLDKIIKEEIKLASGVMSVTGTWRIFLRRFMRVHDYRRSLWYERTRQRSKKGHSLPSYR